MNEPADISLRFDALSTQRGVTDTAAVRRRKVLVVGLFPPPINGQRIVTQRMFEQISGATTAMRYDLNRFPRLRSLSKLLSTVMAAAAMVAARRKGFAALYLAPHSGGGLLLSCFLALSSRLLGYELYVHYHSYRHITHHSRLMAAFLGLCGERAVHIVLAPPMEWGLRHLYPSVHRVAVVSNSVFVVPRPVPRAFDRPRLRIGHLSNLSREKGIGIVLECLRRLLVEGTDVELVLGGPATDRATRALISDAAAEFGGRLSYLGALESGDVQRFYDKIDVFLFPTLYEHEAEPLVIIDAMSAGVPVLATNRGCIAYLLRASDGCTFDAFEFVDHAVERIATWARSPTALSEASASAQARFRELHVASREHLTGLINALVDRA